MRRLVPWAGSASGLALLLLVVPAPATAADIVAYLAVEANEGGSSGGHVALRLGDVVYHFQHHTPGVLRLHRDDANGFLFTYGLLQNRGIAVNRIAASGDTYELLRSWFNRCYLVEEGQFDGLDALRDDRTLIALFLRRAAAMGVAPAVDDTIALRGAGYFFADGAALPDTAPSGALVVLRRTVEETYGVDFISRRSDDIRAALAQLTPRDASSFARTYADLMTDLAALDVLQLAASPRPGSFHAPAPEEFALASDERAVLAAFAAQLQESLVRLLRSPRPDWGFPLLMGMARLATLHEAVRTGRMVFLDAYGDAARVVPHRVLRERPVMMAELLDDARADLQVSRHHLVSSAPLREADFTQFESAGNRFLEILRAGTEGGDVRVQSGPLLPARRARRGDLIEPLRSAAAWEQDLAAADQRLRAAEQTLHARYEYNLITRNCVSEIFRGVNAGLAEAPPGAAAIGDSDVGADDRMRMESRARLGGYIEPGASLMFIPFVSERAVRATYAVAETQQLPSFRTRRLAEMYGRENPVVVFLRESNIITSTVYAHNPRDSFFVFFTDSVPARPLLGSLNLAASLGASAVGLATLPLDGGEAFLSGLKGALFSLPELAFVSLRKGTFDYVERQYRQQQPGAG